ncbi:hypothetical protein [Bradyrhizobium sp. CB3481]|uniref:hypothetical protein n=1 Tax=Bradyrhizobium sp. CB3481 TaxID=3039158 RepID=UPI0024B16DA3|nr:hypothetical protein [Bradyrhizobium sp. CB3481]WFU17352.1 hypothetical protein QA643_03035 [Bradyrhizobium sp. CB3481]
MYRRANLSRTFVLVVALLLAAVSTGAFARGFHTQDPQTDSQGDRQGQSAAEQEQTGTRATAPDRTIVALIGTIAPLLVWRPDKTERI